MRIDTEFIEKLRNSVNIVDLVGSYVQLRKSGQNHMALCPFHSEKTPSFSVSESKQLFKCFGCGIGGDVFGFVSEIENLSFPEAVTFLAERHGIAVPRETSGVSEEELEKKNRLFEIMKLADHYFRKSLSQDERARNYLGTRQIDEGTSKAFGLGFAPPDNELLRFLQSRRFRNEEIELCGLSKRSDSGEFYAKFRNRIMFPIRNLTGKSIAFGGRILGDGRPKYLNSPDTPLYKKGFNLYALDVTRDEIRQRDFAILVEGYFDCIVPFQFGVTNMVASLGTGLTDGQVRLLGRYTRNVIVNFDPDSAGVAAAIRSIDLFLREGFHVNVLRLPEGEDPDSFILSKGVDAYWDHVKNSLPYLDYLLEHFFKQERNPFTPKAKQEITSRILPYVARIPNRVERAEHVSRIASKIRVDEAVLMREVRNMSRSGSSREEVRTRSVTSSEITMAEQTILAALLEGKTDDLVTEELDSTLFEGLVTESLFKTILSEKNHSGEISVVKIRENLEEEDLEWFDQLNFHSSDILLTEETIRNCLEAIRRLQMDRLSRKIQEEIAEQERLGVTSDRLDELLRKKENLRRQSQLG